jgi:hypothetical protein
VADNPWAKTSSSGGGSNPWGGGGKKTNTTKSSLTSIKKNQAAAQPNLWQNIVKFVGSAIDTIDRPRNAIDSALYDATSGHSGGIGGVLNAGWQGLTGQQHHSFNDVLKNMGPNWNNGGLGFVGDVVTDPLTYLSFGAVPAAKSVLKPFVKNALDEAAQVGAKQGTKQFADILAKHTQSDTAIHALNTAQAQGNKALVSVGVPFGKKLTLVNKPLQFQKQTQLVSPEAAQSLASNMSKVLGTGKSLSPKSPQAQALANARHDLISHIIGRPITSTKDLNTQEYDFINNIWHNSLEQSAKNHYNPKNLPDPFAGVIKPKSKASKTQWETFVNTHYQNVFNQPLPKPVAQMTKQELKQYGNQINSHLNQVSANNYAQALQGALGNVKNDFTKLGKTYTHYDGLTGFSPATKKLFVKDGANGLEATKLGQVQEKLGNLLGSRRFVSLPSQIADHRVSAGMGHILGAGNKSYAYSHQFIQDLKHNVAKMPEFKNLTPDEWKEVAYTIEGKRPTYAGYVPPDPAKQAEIDKVVEKLVGDPNNPAQMDSFLKRLNDVESGAGLKRGNVAQYFPHVYNLKNNVDFQDLQADLLNMGTRGKQIAAGLKNGLSGFQKGRTEFNTMADLTDALDAAKQSGNQAFLDRYKDVSWNPLEAFGKRAVSGMQQVAKKESIDAVIRDGLALNRNRKLPDGWMQVGSQQIPKGSPLEELKGQIVPKEIHNDLMKVNKLFTNDTELNNFMEKADHILSILRRNYTVTKFGFHIRQSIGNIFQNTLAGVNGKAYAQAAKFLAHPDRYKQWEKELLENGVIHTGTSGADLANNLGEELNTRLGAKTIGQLANPIGQNFALAKAGRTAGEYEDNIARAAHYFYMRNKGLSPQAAADSVRKYLFNYSEITTTGQAIRRIIPFYQWMRNNLPFQLVNTLKNPKSYNIAQSLLRNYQGNTDPNDAIANAGIYGKVNQDIVQKLIEENGGVLPKYIQDNYIHTPLGYYSIGLPTQDVKEVATNPGAYFFGGMNPYLSLIFEMRNNQSSLNNAPIDKSVPTGQSIWTTPTGMNHMAETALGSPWQILNGLFRGTTQGSKLGKGDYSNVLKGTGLNFQNMDTSKAINNLLYQKALELNTKAKATKAANGGN